MTSSDYSFPSREEYFRLLEEEWSHTRADSPSLTDVGDGTEDGSQDGSEGRSSTSGSNSGSASLRFDFTKQTIKWFFDPVSLTIYSPQLNKQISLKKLDSPTKISRLLAVLSRHHGPGAPVSSAAIYFALEQASRMIYRDSLFNVLSFHSHNNFCLAWSPLETDLIYDNHRYHPTASPF